MDKYPILNTERLVLRPLRISDAQDVQCLAGDKDVASPTSIPHPYEDGEAERWIKKSWDDFEQYGHLTFAINNTSGHFVGAINLQLTPIHERAELGYWIGKPYWNLGYATEAAREVMRYGFEVLKLNRITAGHFTRNPASGRVLEKIGMIHEGHFRKSNKKWGVFEDVDEYGILKEEFKIS